MVNFTGIDGVAVVITTPYVDHRGAFSRLYCERELGDVIGARSIVQVNLSRTAAVGGVRGMHFQHPPYAEMKLVRCLRGGVWDVAVDLRAGSPTFLKWHGEELTPENARMLVIPEGCAHGFQVIAPNTELLYLHTAFYTPEAEDGVRYDDTLLRIKWPLAVTEVSKRDASLPAIDPEFSGIHL